MSTYRLQVLITPGLDSRIRKAANRRRLTKGEWVRRAIEQALNEDRGPGDAVDRLARLSAPTADIDQMLAEIEAGRG
jgi:predicted transcriptional regulator